MDEYGFMVLGLGFIFFARAVLVRDLRPLALPCCSKDYGKAKSGEKRFSLRKGKTTKKKTGNLYNTLLSRSLCTRIILQRSIGK